MEFSLQYFFCGYSLIQEFVHIELFILLFSNKTIYEKGQILKILSYRSRNHVNKAPTFLITCYKAEVESTIYNMLFSYFNSAIDEISNQLWPFWNIEMPSLIFH
jgi:hypothetical protein